MNQPLPIGYYEAQQGWVVSGTGDTIERYNEALESILTKTKQERPDLMIWSTRVETVRDGAGRAHMNLYVGFVPKVPSSTPPLNPHNLNEAPVQRLGDRPDFGAMQLGRKEQKF